MLKSELNHSLFKRPGGDHVEWLQLNWLLDSKDAMRLKPDERLHFCSVFTGYVTGTSGSMPRTSIALNQLPDDIKALKPLVAGEVACNE